MPITLHLPAARPAQRRGLRARLGGALAMLGLPFILVACGGGGGEADPPSTKAISSVAGATATGPAASLSPQQALGKEIFFDPNLSANRNQACAACHAPDAGWTGPDAAANLGGAVYQGSVSDRFGNRKPPSSAYATASPIFHLGFDEGDAMFVGGNFWDGRATGEVLGNPAADQAQGPFLNPLEQALGTGAEVVARVCTGNYADLFKAVWGETACDPSNADAAYGQVALSIAAYEASAESNAYTSKYDYYLKGELKLSQQERLGLSMFKGKAKCAACHRLDPGPNGEPPLLTDFTFDNLGLPRNPDNPFYTASPEFNPLGFDWIDEGLGAFVASRPEYSGYAAAQRGKHKVPTLRNVDKRPAENFVKAFGHNGYFKSLKGIVHFYNTRDTKPRCASRFTPEADALAQGCWPDPEVAENVNRRELGNLHLTPAQEDALVAFMQTLSDGYPMPAR